MPPKDWSQSDFDDYEGYLEPQASDIGDENSELEFEWIEQFVVKNATKHNVSSEEIEQVFRNNPRRFFRQKGRMLGDDLYIALGVTDTGRHLFVLHILKASSAIMPISARDMEQSERKRYERK